MEAEPQTKVVPLVEPQISGNEAQMRPLRRKIGRYEVLQRLGHGGMASVFLARATGSAGFEKQVAIKVIHPHLAAEPNLVEMFLDEARIAAQIHNPHVVEILDLGHDRGDYYMVMEYVEGETLSALIRRQQEQSGHLPLPVVLQILLDACEGLRAAHELRDADGNPLGVIHRDVSPQNLLIDLDGWVRIVDFGIMKAKGKRTDTRTGQLRGKLPYMAPEQAEAKPVTLACDLFALGVILWELCTGTRLFAGESDAQTLSRVIACERPSLAELRPDLPESLERVLARTLARDPSERYASAGEMLRELRQILREVATKDGREPRSGLAAIMREYFGQQAEYRRATLRSKASPKIALVGDGRSFSEEQNLTSGAAGQVAREAVSDPDDLQTRRDLPVLSVVPAVAEDALEFSSSGLAPVGSTTGAFAKAVSLGQTSAPSRWGVWLALPMVGALIAVLLLVASGFLRTPDGEAAPRESPQQQGVAESLRSEQARPAQVEVEIVRWVINSDPDGARVRISGASSPEQQSALDEQLAGRTTPLDVQLPRSEEESLTLEIYMSGYQSTTEKRLPLVTENLRYVLHSVAGQRAAANDTHRERASHVRFSARPKKKKPVTPIADDPLPPPTFDKPLKKRAPGGG